MAEAGGATATAAGRAGARTGNSDGRYTQGEGWEFFMWGIPRMGNALNFLLMGDAALAVGTAEGVELMTSLIGLRWAG